MKYLRWAAIVAIIILAFFAFRHCNRTYKPSKKPKSYRIARDPQWSSLFLMGKATNLLVFSNEVLNAIAKEEGLTLTFYQTNSEYLLFGLEKNTYDAVLSPLYPLKSRQAKYNFSDPYFYTGPVIVVPQDSSVTSIRDLRGLRVGLLKGSQSILSLERFPPSIIVKSYDNINMAMEEMSGLGTINAAIMNLVPAYILCNNLYSQQLKVASPPLTDEGIRLVTLADTGSPELIEHFNRGLQKIKDNGTYYLLLNKWKLSQGYPPENQKPQYFGLLKDHNTPTSSSHI
ncbi:MAG: substrate-binding periplasmic protein [Chlamydiota bacterium]